MNKRILDNIEPYILKMNMYNEKPIYYGHCWYGAFLTLAHAFKKDTVSLLNNVFYVYGFNEENLNDDNYFYLEAIDVKEIETILPFAGIELVKKFPDPEQIIPEITNTISQGKPVGVCIDLFYQPGRTAFYQKIHGGGHIILVYGYDSDNQIFYTIDDVQGMNRYTLTYDELYSCYKGQFQYCDFTLGKSELYFEFRFIKERELYFPECKSSVNPHIYEFAKNTLYMRGQAQESLKSILRFADVFKNVYQKPDLVNTLNFIINGKIAEHYRLVCLTDLGFNFSNMQHQIQSLLTEIVFDWNKVRLPVARSVLSSRAYDFSLEEVEKIIRGIYEKENRYFDLICTLINKLL